MSRPAFTSKAGRTPDLKRKIYFLFLEVLSSVEFRFPRFKVDTLDLNEFLRKIQGQRFVSVISLLKLNGDKTDELSKGSP